MPSNPAYMMGTQPNSRQAQFFSYHVDLERRLSPDHLLRRVAGVLNLDFVLPAVAGCYGRSGNVSLDPRVVLKMMLLLFLYDVPSERELMEQIEVRMDFLWFLGFELDTPIPDHSVLSKARTRWGAQVFEQLFIQTVQQCVAAGLVDGRLLHADSTMVKAAAHKDSVVPSGPELVGALRQAYQAQEGKLRVLSEASLPSPASPSPAVATTSPAAPERVAVPEAVEARMGAPAESVSGPVVPGLRALPRPIEPLSPADPAPRPAGPPLPVNSTHISTTDPLAELARSKHGLTELNYKHHRLVDNTHGVITALRDTTANVPDATQLPALYEQHLVHTGLKLGQVTVAGDHHYGTADNYLYCVQAGLRPHLAAMSAQVQRRGQLPPEQFVYEPEQDRLRCPQGHYLVLQQERPQEQAKVYRIEAAAHCATCPVRGQCTSAKAGRTVQRHVQAQVVQAARTEASSAAGRYSRQRRQHVMEGSFADAVNNHGAKQARWRGLWRQRIQSWLIAAVQNLRILLRRVGRRPAPVVVALAAADQAGQAALPGPSGGWRHLGVALGLNRPRALPPEHSPVYYRWRPLLP